MPASITPRGPRRLEEGEAGEPGLRRGGEESERPPGCKRGPLPRVVVNGAPRAHRGHRAGVHARPQRHWRDPERDPAREAPYRVRQRPQAGHALDDGGIVERVACGLRAKTSRRGHAPRAAPVQLGEVTIGPAPETGGRVHAGERPPGESDVSLAVVRVGGPEEEPEATGGRSDDARAARACRASRGSSGKEGEVERNV